MKQRELWLITGLTFFSAIFKLLAATARSLWLDEGYTLYRIASSWAMNLRNQISLPEVEISSDPHPPVYFLIAKAFMIVGGNSEFIIKMASAFAGILFVPLLFVMVRRLFSARAAFIAALLAALSPLIAWYSDELRSYSLVASEAALCVYLGYLALVKGRGWMWLAWGAALITAQFTHWAFVGFLIAHLLVVIPRFAKWLNAARSWSSRQKTGFVFVILIFVISGMAMAWLFDAPSILKRVSSGAEYSYSFVPLNTLIASIFSGVIFGVNLVDPANGLLIWLAALCFVICVVALWRARACSSRRRAVYLTAASAIGSAAVWFAISLVKPNYHGIRHLIMVAPPVLAIFSAAIDLALSSLLPLTRWTGRIGLAALLMCSSAGLASVYLPTPEKEDNWRDMAQLVRQGWQPRDLLIGNAGTPLHILRSYIGAQVPIDTIYTSELGAMPPAERDAFYAAHDRVWFANTGGVSLDQSEARELTSARLISNDHVGARTITLELLLLELRPRLFQSLPADAVAIRADGNTRGPQIAGYAISAGSPFANRPWVKFSLFWRPAEDKTISPNVSLRLENNDEVWLSWNSAARLQNPPAEWKEDALWQIDYAVPTPFGLPVQPYQLNLVSSANDAAQIISQPLAKSAFESFLRVAIWNPSRAERPELQLKRARMDAARATFNAQITSPGTDDEQIADFDEVVLASAIYPDVIRPGDVMPIALNWRARQNALAGWDNQARLEPVIGGAVAQAARAAGTQDAPVSNWQIGEINRDQLSLQTPFTLSPGLYRLQVSRIKNKRVADEALAGWVRVENYPSSPAPAPITHTLSAKIGEAALLGWEPPISYTRGLVLELRTFWQFNAQPARQGVLFIHVVGPDGKVVAQYDNAPWDGKRDTRSFRAGDGLDQLNPIILKPNLPGGEYVIYAGIYTRQDVVRWDAIQDGQPAKDNMVRLGSFTLKNRLLPAVYLPLITSFSQK